MKRRVSNTFTMKMLYLWPHLLLYTEVLPIQQLLGYIYTSLLPPCSAPFTGNWLSVLVTDSPEMSYVIVVNSPEDVLWKIVSTASGFSLLFFDIPQLQQWQS